MNSLQLLLSSKLCTIKDLHAEIVLIICHSLIANYLNVENYKSIKSNSLLTEDEDEDKWIYNFMNEIFIYLNQNITIYPKILQIMTNTKKN